MRATTAALQPRREPDRPAPAEAHPVADPLATRQHGRAPGAAPRLRAHAVQGFTGSAGGRFQPRSDPPSLRPVAALAEAVQPMARETVALESAEPRPSQHEALVLQPSRPAGRRSGAGAARRAARAAPAPARPGAPVLQYCGAGRPCGCGPGGQHGSGTVPGEPARRKPLVQLHGGMAARGPPSPPDVLRDLGAGSPIPASIAEVFSEAYGSPLGHVRVHPDSPVAAEHGTEALTVGSDIAFAPGRYQPDTPSGHELIGHELAHVVQQSGGTPGVQAAAGPAGDAHESEADSAAHAVVSGEPVPTLSAVVAPRAPIQREGEDRSKETYAQFVRRVKDHAVRRLEQNVATLGEWRTYIAEMSDFNLHSQLLSAKVKEYAVSAANRPGTQGPAMFERMVGTQSASLRQFEESRLAPDAPYKYKADAFMGLLDSACSGYWTTPAMAQQLGEYAGILPQQGQFTQVYVPPDPRYKNYCATMEAFRSGDIGGCETCHRLNAEWQRTGHEYGSPLPGVIPTRTELMFEANAPLFARPASGFGAPVQFDPKASAVLQAWIESLDTPTAGATSAAPAVQRKASTGSSAPAVQFDDGAGKPGSPFQPAPTPIGIELPKPRSDLCGPLPPAETGGPSKRTDPSKWGENSKLVADAIARIGTVLEPIGPRGYRIIPWRSFDQLWSAGPDELAGVRNEMLNNVDQRRRDYETLKNEIKAGLVPYEELCPIVDELLPTTNERVQRTVLFEIEMHRLQEKIVNVILAVVGAALLLLAILFPPLMLTAPVIIAGGATAVAGLAVGARDYRRGHQIGLGTGAKVYSPMQEAQAPSLRFWGAFGIVMSVIGIVSTWSQVARAASRASSVAGAASKAPAAGAVAAESRPVGLLSGTRVSDMPGGGKMFVHPDFPNEVAFLDADGLTLYSTARGPGAMDEIAHWPASSLEKVASGAPVPPPARGSLPPPPAAVGAGARPAQPLLTGPTSLAGSPQGRLLLTGAPNAVPVPPGLDPRSVIPLAGGAGFMLRGPIITPPRRMPLLLPEMTSAPLPPGDWVITGFRGAPGFENLPRTSLPFAGSRAWGHSGGNWGLYRPAQAPELPVTVQVYTGTGGDRGIVLDIAGDVRSLHTEPVLSGGAHGRGYPMTTPEMTDPLTGNRLARSHLDPHNRSRLDVFGVPSTRDRLNYVGHDTRYNEWVRRTLEGRLDSSQSSWQAIEIWANPRTTTGGFPIVTEEIIIQLGPNGAPMRAWRFPTTEGFYDNMHNIEQVLGPRAAGGFQIPLDEVPPTLVGATGPTPVPTLGPVTGQ